MPVTSLVNEAESRMPYCIAEVGRLMGFFMVEPLLGVTRIAHNVNSLVCEQPPLLVADITSLYIARQTQSPRALLVPEHFFTPLTMRIPTRSPTRCTQGQLVYDVSVSWRSELG